MITCFKYKPSLQIDSNWNIKLCDFGLSRVKSKLGTSQIFYNCLKLIAMFLDKKKNAGRIGTPHWMAPEILREEKYGEYSDIYSYGMILWEMVSRETPFKGFSITQIIGSVGFDNYRVPIPQKGNPLILKVMERCLNRDIDKRPSFKVIVEWLESRNREKEKKSRKLDFLIVS